MIFSTYKQKGIPCKPFKSRRVMPFSAISYLIFLSATKYCVYCRNVTNRLHVCFQLCFNQAFTTIFFPENRFFDFTGGISGNLRKNELFGTFVSGKI